MESIDEFPTILGINSDYFHNGINQLIFVTEMCNVLWSKNCILSII
jgi:hypothetical protein